MRKLVVFLLVLALGAGALWWFDSRQEQPTESLPAEPEQREPVRQPEQPSGALTSVGEADGTGAQVALSGALDLWANDTSDPAQPRKRSHLVAADCRTLGEGRFELSDASLELFEPTSGEGEATAKATRAEARLKVDPAPALDEEHPVVLEDAELRYERGSRFAPLLLRIPRLETVVALERATSPEVVVLEGRGLSVSGRGLLLERKSESLTIQDEPRARVVLEDGSSAALSSRARLVVRSRPDLGADLAELDIEQDARIAFDGEVPLELRADRIRLIGSIEQGASARLRPLRAEAEGHVVITQKDGVARGERLLLDFDATGKPSKATLDGRPELEAVLSAERLEGLPEDRLREGEALAVRLDGAGPLELSLGSSRDFLFTGPARVRLPALDALLECDTSIRGTSGAAVKGGPATGELIAEGNVRFNYGRARVTTVVLRASSFLDATGKAAVRIATESSTRVVAELDDGSSVDVLAEGGLDAEQREDNLYLPRARNVTFSLGGERALSGRADSVTDLDVERVRLIATGHVQVKLPEGEGRGERFEARSAESGELSGSESELARVEVAEGWFEARFIDLQPGQVEARDDAHGKVARDGVVHDVRAGWIVLQRDAKLEDVGDPAELLIDAGEAVFVERTQKGENLVLRAERFHAEARARGIDEFDPTLVVALGDVQFALFDSAPRYEGRGHRLELRGDRTGRLEPAGEGEKVSLSGRVGERAERVKIDSSRIDFAPDRLVAGDFETEFDGLVSGLGASGDSRTLRAIGGLMAIDPTQVTLSEGVYLGGSDSSGQPWSLDADLLVLRARRVEGELDEEAATASLVDLVAQGTVRLDADPLGRARAEVLTVEHDSRRITLLGDPARPTAREATIERGGVSWSSPEFTFDLATGFLQSESGSVRSSPDDLQNWSISYEALEPLTMEDRTALIFRQPTWREGANVLRANWALLWVDQGQWQALSSDREPDPNLVEDPDARERAGVPKVLFGGFPLHSGARWLQELYLDGDVEYRINDVRKARADGVYLDLVDGHGWVHQFVLDIELPIGSRNYYLKVEVDWLRTSADGSMSAVGAVATTCQHDVPHYKIRIGNFAVVPRYRKEERRNERSGAVEELVERDGWDIELDNNEIALAGGLGLPLPRIAGPMTNDYKLDQEALSVGGFRLPSFGSDSKLGTFISASISGELGWIGDGFSWLFDQLTPDLDLPEPEGSNRARVDLTSRGIVLGLETQLRAADIYRYDINLDTVWDTGKDRGLVRVDRADRGDLRSWFHTRGRFRLGEDEWIDTVLTYQTDPGVQAEFWESNYLAYEERENFVYWRKVRDMDFFSATAEARIEDFRTAVIDQPSLSWLSGRAEVGRLAGHSVVASTAVSLDHLARFDGDPKYESPFADGLGDRSVTRIDAGQRVELPIDMEFGGVRTTPFLEARATGWSDDVSADSSASRAALIAGVTTSTSLWRTFADGSRHVVTPSVELRGDLVSGEDNLPVVEFDVADRSIEGRYVDFNLRSRWENRELTSDLDIELSQTWADEVGIGLQDGWLPSAARVNWLSVAFGIPYGVLHDGRYDTDSGETNYSQTIAGFEPYQDLTLETGYHFARDTAGLRLYEALTVGARYALSAKWEVEGRQTLGVGSAEDQLAYSVSLRRFGHDFVLEIQNSYIAGEGVGSLRFNITPNFAWRRDDGTLLDRWRALRR